MNLHSTITMACPGKSEEEISLHVQDSALEVLGEIDMRYRFHYDGDEEGAAEFAFPQDLCKLVTPGWTEQDKAATIKLAAKVTRCCCDANLTPVIQPKLAAAVLPTGDFDWGLITVELGMLLGFAKSCNLCTKAVEILHLITRSMTKQVGHSKVRDVQIALCGFIISLLCTEFLQRRKLARLPDIRRELLLPKGPQPARSRAGSALLVGANDAPVGPGGRGGSLLYFFMKKKRISLRGADWTLLGGKKVLNRRWKEEYDEIIKSAALRGSLHEEWRRSKDAAAWEDLAGAVAGGAAENQGRGEPEPEDGVEEDDAAAAPQGRYLDLSGPAGHGADSLILPVATRHMDDFLARKTERGGTWALASSLKAMMRTLVFDPGLPNPDAIPPEHFRCQDKHPGFCVTRDRADEERIRKLQSLLHSWGKAVEGVPSALLLLLSLLSLLCC